MEPKELQSKVAETIKNNSPISLPKVAKMLGVHKRFVETAAKQLNEDCLIEYSGGRMWKWKGD